MYHYVTLSRLMPRISAKLPGVPWEAYGSSAGLSSSGRAAAGPLVGSVDRWIGRSGFTEVSLILGVPHQGHQVGASSSSPFACVMLRMLRMLRCFIYFYIVSCNPLPFRHFYDFSCVVTTTHQESELVRLQWPLHCQRFDHSINTAASKNFKHLSEKCWKMFVSNWFKRYGGQVLMHLPCQAWGWLVDIDVRLTDEVPSMLDMGIQMRSNWYIL